MAGNLAQGRRSFLVHIGPAGEPPIVTDLCTSERARLASLDELPHRIAEWTAADRTAPAKLPVRGLTKSELRVAILAAEGLTNKEIAAALGLRLRTVETHLTNVYHKIEGSRQELARAIRAPFES